MLEESKNSLWIVTGVISGYLFGSWQGFSPWSLSWMGLIWLVCLTRVIYHIGVRNGVSGRANNARRD